MAKNLNVMQQAEELLKTIYEINDSLGAFIKQEELYRSLKIKGDAARIRDISYLIDDVLVTSWKYLDVATNGTKYKITPEGFKYLHEISYRSYPSEQAFCALWFNDKMETFWNRGVLPAVNKAGYKALRIDEQHFTEDIVAKILLSIKASKFVMADLTGNRGGVYFELGYAKALGIPIIQTCEREMMNSINNGPHFDVSHFPIKSWDNDGIADFSKKLHARIINILN